MLVEKTEYQRAQIALLGLEMKGVRCIRHTVAWTGLVVRSGSSVRWSQRWSGV